MISRDEQDRRVAEFAVKREQFKADWFAHVRFLSVSPFGERQLNQELAVQGMRRADLHRALTIDVKIETLRSS